jgi:outer membrane immunogenic protein
VFGLEAQGDWAGLRGSNESLFFPGLTNHSKMDAFGLFTGQVGWAWNNTLLYVKGGAAVTDNQYQFTSDANGAVLGRSSDDTRWGAVVGAGLEFGFAPNWSAAVEYDHIFMGDRNTTFTDPVTGAFAGADRISGDADLVTVRVNYRWGGPVIGRY